MLRELQGNPCLAATEYDILYNIPTIYNRYGGPWTIEVPIEVYIILPDGTNCEIGLSSSDSFLTFADCASILT